MEHAFNTFLNAKSIGSNFRCYHNVTLGQKGGKIPTIGNNVTISCGGSVFRRRNDREQCRDRSWLRYRKRCTRELYCCR